MATGSNIAVLDLLAGQPRASRRLAAALARPSHAYLLAGPEHTGKHTAAQLFAQALLCPQGGCGACASCEAVTGYRHPDYRVWDVLEGEKTFKVDQVRELITQVGRRPFQGTRSVHVLAAMDMLAPAGANALLKTLEEPPSTAVLLLLTRDLETLLPTILSRCQLVPFGLTPAGAIAAHLHAHARLPMGAGPAHFEQVAARAQGRIGQAISWASQAQPEAPTLDLPEGLGLPAMAWAERLAGLAGPDQQAALVHLVAWLRDAAWLAAGGDAARVALPAEVARTAALAPSRAPEAWVAIAEAAEAARDRLDRHVNARLTLDRLAAVLAAR